MGRSAGKSSITSSKGFAGSAQLFHDPVFMTADLALTGGYLQAFFPKKRNTMI
jgi:hypothetical protein